MNTAASVITEDQSTIKSGKLEILFENICVALFAQNIKHTPYRKEFYICISMRGLTKEKLIKLLDAEVEYIYKKKDKKCILKINESTKKATIFFIKKVKR